MEKKIRITLLKNVVDIIESDCVAFKITKNYLLNYIFTELKHTTYSEDKVKKGEKVVLQFNLNKKNKENYYDFIIEKNVQVEADFIRNLIYKYANQSKSSRELFVFKVLVDKINFSIKNERVLIVTFNDKRKTKILPFHIGGSKLELGNYIFCYDLINENYKNYKLSNINSIFITTEEKKWQDKEYVRKTIDNFDPFLSAGNEVKAKLTKNGKHLFENILLNRPEVVSCKKNFFVFKCSEEQAKRYFAYFLDEVEILEPLSLREWFMKKMENALKKYTKQ